MPRQDQEPHIRPFAPGDQSAVRRLVLEGLGERWGWIDEMRNPDLDDIAAHYVAPGHYFVVVEQDGKLIGTGALVAEGADRQATGRIVRMSVAPEHRGRGLGRALVEHLLDEARRRGYRGMLVETTKEWHDAIRLYQRCGFVEYARDDEDVHLALDPRRPPG